jgi:uncharacterized SAM-binding protein YcdF (DUF218 family)
MMLAPFRELSKALTRGFSQFHAAIFGAGPVLPLRGTATGAAMFFFLSRLLWIFFAPSHFLAWMVIAAAVLLTTKYERIGRHLAVAAAILFFLIGVMPLGSWLVAPLENRFPRQDWPAHVDGILVLGGGLHSEILEARGVPASENSEIRLVTAFEAARHYPNARVVFSGGIAELGGSGEPETVAAKFIFGQIGLAPARLAVETQSRNTWENIALSRKMVKPAPGEVWLLATSAYHMPRAMLAAKKLHWKMIAWPTDYKTARTIYGTLFGIPENLGLFDEAFHEWLGLFAYWLK